MNKKYLKYWFQPKAYIFKDFKENALDCGTEKNRIFINRNSNILFVAHVDTVLPPKFIKRTRRRIYAHGLDDRLGCWMAYQLSEKLNVDLLITDYEESVKSTAEYHNCKSYNWIAEFDRAGDDCVTYELDNQAFKKALLDYWRIGFGSFSDICWLKTNACCVNIGIGYYLNHSPDSYAVLKTMKKQINKFEQFYQKHKGTKFVRDYQLIQIEPTLMKWKSSRRAVIYNPDDYMEDFEGLHTKGLCEICNSEVGEIVYGHYICYNCFSAIFEQSYSLFNNP